MVLCTPVCYSFSEKWSSHYLCFVTSCVQPIIQLYEFEKNLYNQSGHYKNLRCRVPQYINCHLKVKEPLHFIASCVQPVMNLKWISAIKVATAKITNNLHYKWRLLCAYHKCKHFLWWAKMNGTQTRVLVSSWRMHYMYSKYSSMAKGIYRIEVTSNSEKINLVAA